MCEDRTKPVFTPAKYKVKKKFKEIIMLSLVPTMLKGITTQQGILNENYSFH
jgi:hypothetical protein